MPRIRRSPGERSDRDGREARIDPLCHTLVGTALARGGLGKRTALGASALVIGANLPDLDVLAYFGGAAADLEWRRGWTHGILALAVLPFILTGALLLFHRIAIRRRQWLALPALAPRQLLLLSFVAITSHPVLDSLNSYGVRWLMPFSGEWFYGDTLFIIDPWVWLALGLGLYVTVRRQKSRRAYPARPVQLALGAVTLYVAAMAVSGRAARRIVGREAGPGPGVAVHDAMAGPVPLNPLVREFVVELGRQYRAGTFRWLRHPHTDRDELRTFSSERPSHPAVSLAVETTLGRQFLGWARYPVFDIQEMGSGRFLVHIIDLRYAREAGTAFGTVSIPVTLP